MESQIYFATINIPPVPGSKSLYRASGCKNADATRLGNFGYSFSESRRDGMFVAIVYHPAVLSP
jgi:hypothetical protein